MTHSLSWPLGGGDEQSRTYKGSHLKGEQDVYFPYIITGTIFLQSSLLILAQINVQNVSKYKKYITDINSYVKSTLCATHAHFEQTTKLFFLRQLAPQGRADVDSQHPRVDLFF